MSSDTIYRCPVCGEEFESYGAADSHYDYHKASEYIFASWEVEQR